ncbi:1-phosphofructokinase [Paenibacillus abyssi]|uniref:Tagatose-6-phosphate kinase n=1 Tax=Paenibacillus abyssi TaxID=1340531 RepID=A0A917D145_9BACL|nr:1-phosphofructokinase [Paenibacillus abyssi]GGG02685.1 tagatose-6-phosphate kinase [Paenibacillus abyssi]
MKQHSPVITVTLNPALDKTVTIERFEYGGLNRIKDMRTDAGGKGINVAKVLKQFSLDVTAMGLIAGFQGQVIQEKLKKLGIRSVFLDTEGETRTNLKVVDEQTKQTTELNEPGITAQSSKLQDFIARFEAELSSASLAVLGGSLPPGTPADYYGTLIESAKNKQVRTILDADGEALKQGIEAIPFAIKPNIHELEMLTGRTFTTDEQIISAAGALIERGIEYVAVSMGGEGSLLVSRTEAVRARPFPITPMSTVGAGDSMVATLVYCFLQELSLEQTARWTSAAGTITASKPGTQVCSLPEVQARIDDVIIKRYP